MQWLTPRARGSTLDVRIWRFLDVRIRHLKVNPRTVKIFIIAIDPYHRYLNESERAIYNYFKLKKALWPPWFIQTYFSA